MTMRVGSLSDKTTMAGSRPMDILIGAVISISFSLFGYVYVLTRASFHYQSQNLIELGKNLGFSRKKSFFKVMIKCIWIYI